jgi:hypothetical protein
MGGLRKLNDEGFHKLYSLPNNVRMIKLMSMMWGGYVTHTGEMRKPYRILVGKSERKRPLGRLW